ncbi:(S)-2-hydroxypropylphosphonic acid epoxidase [Sedimentisphaera cyanobacteriorum]|uniref:(S)-2-hydroxypropylphosphonic acid epoxidase n=1 Tax=Sedimentisphaera cyanobacteriorum TaxID=1940790 RepID=A0A1Q2HMK7_9BACT|nr:XRE family transcriptional regulator [Sedimentisphaera cyanobacteriorum]AQQ08521.1 (S)-2-hydroxypropylphosphonic acid epoxidase [Sedimentisphaera cyanobacteriorum]
MADNNKLAERLKQQREQKELDIAQLSKQSGLSTEQIKKLEEGSLAPSLAPLIKIARGLGVRLGTLLDDDPGLSPAVVRGEESEKVVRFSGNSKAARESELDFTSLASEKKDRHMEPFIISVKYSDSVDRCLSSHEGEEFIYVLEGDIEIDYGKHKYSLSKSDSIYYDSIVPHNVHAMGRDAKILAVVYTPF